MRERVAELVRDIGDERPADINGWARAVSDATTDPAAAGDRLGIQLIRIDEVQSGDLVEPFGALDMRVRTADNFTGEQVETEDAGSYCFRVTFNYYGKVGEWSTTDGVDAIECPPGAAPVIPPPDQTIREVVAANARQTVHDVLSELTAAGSPAPTVDQITAAISARLQPPTEPSTVAAPPQVVIDAQGPHSRIGVAMGLADDCVLVKLDNGTVSDVHPPHVLLQPGELGCSPDTALASDEQLRSPH